MAKHFWPSCNFRQSKQRQGRQKKAKGKQLAGQHLKSPCSAKPKH